MRRGDPGRAHGRCACRCSGRSTPPRRIRHPRHGYGPILGAGRRRGPQAIRQIAPKGPGGRAPGGFRPTGFPGSRSSCRSSGMPAGRGRIRSPTWSTNPPAVRPRVVLQEPRPRESRAEDAAAWAPPRGPASRSRPPGRAISLRPLDGSRSRQRRQGKIAREARRTQRTLSRGPGPLSARLGPVRPLMYGARWRGLRQSRSRGRRSRACRSGWLLLWRA